MMFRGMSDNCACSPSTGVARVVAGVTRSDRKVDRRVHPTIRARTIGLRPGDVGRADRVSFGRSTERILIRPDRLHVGAGGGARHGRRRGPPGPMAGRRLSPRLLIVCGHSTLPAVRDRRMRDVPRGARDPQILSRNATRSAISSSPSDNGTSSVSVPCPTNLPCAPRGAAS